MMQINIKFIIFHCRERFCLSSGASQPVTLLARRGLGHAHVSPLLRHRGRLAGGGRRQRLARLRLFQGLQVAGHGRRLRQDQALRIPSQPNKGNFSSLLFSDLQKLNKDFYEKDELSLFFLLHHI